MTTTGKAPGGGGGGGKVRSYISCIGSAAPSGRVFAPFSSENGYTLCPFWSGIAYGQLRELYGSV